MAERAILLTIREIYANRILDGEQVVEHRTRPPRISKPTRTIIYVSGITQIVGEFTMGHINGERDAWGYPRAVTNPIRYGEPLAWATIRRKIRCIRSPQQSFRYLDPANFEDGRLLAWLDRISS